MEDSSDAVRTLGGVGGVAGGGGHHGVLTPSASPNTSHHTSPTSTSPSPNATRTPTMAGTPMSASHPPTPPTTTTTTGTRASRRSALPLPPGSALEETLRERRVVTEVKEGDLPLHPDLTGPPTCSGCGRPIADRYLNHVLGAFWHAACLVCTECRVPLQKSCFQNEGKLYCGVHFFRRFGTRCRGCGEGIPPSEMVRRAHHHVYHLACFVCGVCGVQLDTGDHFYLRADHSLVCKADFERARQGCAPITDEDDEDGSAPSTKRPRASINSKQLEELKNAYNVSRKPSRSMREELGKKLGLDVRVVQVWFQNRRAKEKRLKREVVPTSPFTAQHDGFPVPVTAMDDGYHVTAKHGLHDGNHGDFYPKPGGPNSTSGQQQQPPETGVNHHPQTPGCTRSVPSNAPVTTGVSWSCHPYLEAPPGCRDAFSSPPHHLHFPPGGGGGGSGAADGELSSGFGHTSVHGAVVCADNSPPGGQNGNYNQQVPDNKVWLPTSSAASEAGNSYNSVETPVNGSYQFHHL